MCEKETKFSYLDGLVCRVFLWDKLKIPHDSHTQNLLQTKYFSSCSHCFVPIKLQVPWKPWGAFSRANAYQNSWDYSWKKRNSRPQQPFWTRRLNVGLICWGCNKLLYCVGVCSVEPWRTWKAQSKTRFFLFSFPGESPGIFSGLSNKEHWTGDCVFESTSWIRFSGNLKKVKQS